MMRCVSDEIPRFFDAFATFVERNTQSPDQLKRNQEWITRIRNQINEAKSLAKPAKTQFK